MIVCKVLTEAGSFEAHPWDMERAAALEAFATMWIIGGVVGAILEVDGEPVRWFGPVGLPRTFQEA